MAIGRYITVAPDGQYFLEDAFRRLFSLSGCGGPFEGYPSGAFEELSYVNDAFLREAVWYESSAKLKRIMDVLITRDDNQLPISVRWRAYESDGVTVSATVTEVTTYNGVVPVSRERTIT